MIGQGQGQGQGQGHGQNKFNSTKKIKMNTEILKSAIEIAKLLDCDNSQSCEMYEIGKNYFIRTVTMHHIGKLIAISDKEMKLEKACWVADSGRFSQALKNGTLNEVEMFVNPVIINRLSIVDATEWAHNLPTETK